MAWKPDLTWKRCTRCGRTWDGHAGTSCYPVPDPAIDAFDPARPELLEVAEPSRASTGDPSQLEPDDASRRAAAKRPARQVDVVRDASRVTTARARTA